MKTEIAYSKPALLEIVYSKGCTLARRKITPEQDLTTSASLTFWNLWFFVASCLVHYSMFSNIPGLFRKRPEAPTSHVNQKMSSDVSKQIPCRRWTLPCIKYCLRGKVNVQKGTESKVLNVMITLTRCMAIYLSAIYIFHTKILRDNNVYIFMLLQNM